MTPPEEILSTRLRKWQSTGGNSFKACCPAHEDHNPSLSVTIEFGNVLLHCHAGCSQEDVRAALGLSWAQIRGDEEQGDIRYAPHASETREGEGSTAVYGCTLDNSVSIFLKA